MKFFAMKSLAQVFGSLGRFRAVRCIIRARTNTVQLGRFPECRAALIKPFPPTIAGRLMALTELYCS